MDRGQKLACMEKRWFCTSDAVDMQQLVHKRLKVGTGLRWSALNKKVGPSWTRPGCRSLGFFFEKRFSGRSVVVLLANDLERASYAVCLLKSLYTK